MEYRLGITNAHTEIHYLSKEEVTMNSRKIVIAAVATLLTLSLCASAFAGTKTRDRIRVPGTGTSCPR